jgi:transposase-like protein
VDRLGTVCAIAKQRIGRAPVLAQGTLYPDVIEGEVLDVLVQSKRNKHAALKLMRKLLKKDAFVPERLVTDDLRSYSAAVRDLGIEPRHERGRWSRVDDWRSGCRYRGVAVRRQLSHIAGASIRTVAPFPVAARQ